MKLERLEDGTSPIGWKIVSVGDDGSVLCDGPSGQRERFWLLGRAKEIAQLEVENKQLRKHISQVQDAMTTGGMTVGKCITCGCEVACDALTLQFTNNVHCRNCAK